MNKKKVKYIVVKNGERKKRKMRKVGYNEMQAAIRELNREIRKNAKSNAERHQKERRISTCMSTPKETITRLRKKSNQTKTSRKNFLINTYNETDYIEKLRTVHGPKLVRKK